MAIDYDGIQIGDELGPLDKLVTTEDVRTFTKIQREDGGGPAFFTDFESAIREGLPGRIVPGPISMAFMAQLAVSWSDGGWIKKLDVIFRQPVPHGTQVRVSGVVTDKYYAEEAGHVECDIYVESLEGDKLVGGHVVVVIPT